MINCGETKKYLEKSFDNNELKAVPHAEIAEHLASCVSCRGYYDELTAIDSAMKSGGVAMPEDSYWDSYAIKVGMKAKGLPAPGRGKLFSLQGIIYMSSAAAVLLLMSVTYFYFKSEDGGLRATPAVGNAPVDDRRSFELNDFTAMLDKYAEADLKEKEVIRIGLKQHTVKAYEFTTIVIKDTGYSLEQKKTAVEIAGAVKIQLLENTLSSLLPDENLRYSAADALVAMGGRGAIPEWKKLLRQDDSQALAVYALFKTDYEIGVFETAMAYDILQPQVRDYAAEMILNSGKMESGRKILHRMLTSGNPDRRRNALNVLGVVKDAPSTVLIALMAGDAGIKDSALGALVKIGRVSAIKHLAGVVSEGDLAGFIASIYGSAAREDIAAELYGLLGADNVSIKRSALNLLKEYGSAGDAPRLAEFAGDQRIAKEIISVAGAIGDENILAFLTKQLQAGRYGKEAVAAIGGLDTEKAIPVLIKALDTAKTQKDAYTMLKEKTGEDFGGNSLRWRQWWQKSRGEKSSSVKDSFSNC